MGRYNGIDFNRISSIQFRVRKALIYLKDYLI